MFVALHLFPISLLGKVLKWFFLDRFFSFGRPKKWLLVALDRWLPYTVTTVWEFAWADLALVVLGKCLSYRSGHLNRFDCITTPVAAFEESFSIRK